MCIHDYNHVCVLAWALGFGSPEVIAWIRAFLGLDWEGIWFKGCTVNTATQ